MFINSEDPDDMPYNHQGLRKKYVQRQNTIFFENHTMDTSVCNGLYNAYQKEESICIQSMKHYILGPWGTAMFVLNCVCILRPTNI